MSHRLQKNSKKFTSESVLRKMKKRPANLLNCDIESNRSSSCGSRKSTRRNNCYLTKDDSNDDFFIVEKIVGHKSFHGKSFYKVRWQGYNESEDSWEPEENLSNVLDLIEEFSHEQTIVVPMKSDENSQKIRAKTVGGYEYVPSNKLVASKTKYFDDIRDGKIDLSSNDLYSRVKTRKRLHLESETVEKFVECNENDEYKDVSAKEYVECECETKSSENSSSYERSKYFQSNLFEMSAELLKSASFNKSQLTASKSSSNDDISLFNYSISSNTNQSDDLGVQVSPIQQCPSVEATKISTGTQTLSVTNEQKETDEEIPDVVVVEDDLKPQLKKLISKIDSALRKSCPVEKTVTNDNYLLTMYAKQIKQNCLSVQIPVFHRESDLVSIESIDDLKMSIILNKFYLLHTSLKNGVQIEWCVKFFPESLTPLQLAVSKNQVNIVRLFLRFGAPPDYPSDSESLSPLVMASTSGFVHIVKALLEYGAFVDHQTGSDRKTALFYAIENGRIEVVDILLKFGTNFYRVANDLSSVSLVNNLLMTNKLTHIVSFEILSLLRNHHMSLITSLNHTINNYLSKRLAKQAFMIFPYQWVSVMEREFNVEFFLDSSAISSIEIPILLLVHGVQVENNFEFWLQNSCCCVDSVSLNDKQQSRLDDSNFITTLWPLQTAVNRLTVRFTNGSSLTSEEKQLRVAIVAINVNCEQISSSSTETNLSLTTSISRYY